MTIMTIEPQPVRLVCPRCEGNPPQETTRFMHMADGTDRVETGKWPCEFCKGAGWVSMARMQAYQDGKRMRTERVARGESLYAAAQRLGLGSAQLSAIEHGRQPLEARGDQV